MNSEIVNSFSLVGNIASVNEVKEQTNGKKFRYFTLAQNNKYEDKDGELKNVPSFISLKIYEKAFPKFENILKVGNYVNVFGKINVYKDDTKKNNINLIATDIRNLNKDKFNNNEIYDYDWLNDDILENTNDEMGI